MSAPAAMQFVDVPTGRTTLAGDLAVPDRARGVVLFAHGSGSSRRSPRNQRVAHELQVRGFATLLFDLLTPEEERVDVESAEYRFDIQRLAERLAGATDWIATWRGTRGLPVGYFGASTGAAAALVAETAKPGVVAAVVSRGGRPDLAGPSLVRVRTPTLLIVGGEDRLVIDLNRRALDQLNAEKQLAIVPGATHRFEEPGALEEVSRLASTWFERYLVRPA